MPGQQGKDFGVAGAEVNGESTGFEVAGVAGKNVQADRAAVSVRCGNDCGYGRQRHGPSRHYPEALDAQFGFHGGNGGFDEGQCLWGDRLLSTRDVYDAQNLAGVGIVDGHCGAAPRMSEQVEVLCPANLDAAVESESGAGCARTDAAFRPVRSLNEEHLLNLAAQHSIAVDPQEAPRFISDGNDEL